ncbi:MAG: ABC transporter permease subunit [Treponema sp.]|nr:ABC transporter permease subunit [Treponema sp.]
MKNVKETTHPALIRRDNYLRRTWMLYLMLLMPIAFFVVFRYVPMTNIVIAFRHYNFFRGVWATPNPACTGYPHLPGCNHWVGFHYFQEAFSSPAFWRAVRNTLMLNFLDLVMGFPAPIILALLLNEIAFRRFKKFTQTVVYLPHFLSWIIISGMAVQLFAPGGGVVNILLGQLGIGPIDFLMTPRNWVTTYIGLGIWKDMGWGTIIYLASITSISPELYEAAEVDGAGRLRKIWSITLPGIRPTIMVLLILRLGIILGSEFDRPFAMQNPTVMEVADVLSTYVYRVGIRSGQFSLTAAVGLFQSIICVAFLVMANALAKKTGERGVW